MKITPSLKQLEYVVALAEKEHFTKAAEACNVTSSTLSAGIRDLEHLLGIPIAERSKRVVIMTPLGLEVARRARIMLRDGEDIMELAAANREPLEGELRLGVVPTVGPYLLPRVLPRLRQRYPRLKMFLREDLTDNLLARLRTGELDACLLALPYDTEGLQEHYMFDDPFMLACLTNNEMAGKSAIKQRDLDISILLLLEDGHCLRGHALEACMLQDRPSRRQFESTSLYTLVQMVSSGMGITLLPQLAVEGNITHGTDIKLVPIAGNPSRQIGMVWRRTSPRSDEYTLLADELCP